MTAYQRVCVRFARDLADPRDLALSRAAALMLVAEFAVASDRADPIGLTR